MTPQTTPIEPKPTRTLRRMPPLVTAALLFFGHAIGAVRLYIHETNFSNDAVSEGNNFLNALNEHRYADATSMADSEVKVKMTDFQIRKLAEAMQNADGRIVYELDSGSELTTTDDYRAILLDYRVHSRTGWRPVVISLLESPTGLKVSGCTVNP